MMELNKIYAQPPMPMNLQRNENLYQICVYGSIGRFILNLNFAYMELFYLSSHNYEIITELIAVVLLVVIAFGCFMSLATLYTVTLNEIAYHHLRPTCLAIAGVYLSALSVAIIWVLIQSMESTHHWELFKLILWPFLLEFVSYIVVAYAFHNLHSVAVPVQYVMVPQQIKTVEIPLQMGYYYNPQ